MKTSPEKLLIRNICYEALQKTSEFTMRRQRIETSVVDNLTLQIKVWGEGNSVPTYLTVKITGKI